MSDTRVTTYWKGLLVLVMLGLSLPTLALEPISIIPNQNLTVFFSGLIYGSLGILSLYNLSLFFTQRDKSSLFFLAYVVCILIWMNISLVNFTSKMVPLPATDRHLELPIELILLIPFSAGLFLMAFTEKTFRRIDKSNFTSVAILLLLLLTGICLFNFGVSISSKNTIILALLGVSSLSYSVISSQQIKTPSSPILFCFVGMILPFFYTIYLSIEQYFNPDKSSFLSITTAFIFLLQAIVFTFALNYKRKKLLIEEIHAITADLHSKIEVINTQNHSLDNARKKALKASNIKSRFLANISHEIRTPLNAILGFSQQLKNNSQPEERTEQINLINIASQNLSSLVNELLDFSKIEAGKFKITNSKYHSLEFFEDIVEINSKSAQLKQLAFNFYLNNLPRQLEGDFLRIKQVITNLLSNALKFTQSGHVSLSVVCNNLPNEMVELIIKVDDTGSGISENNIKKLFSAFSQVDDEINIENQGSGLGLAISRDIIKMMKGSINVISEERIGTSFVVKVQQKVLDSQGIYDNQDSFIDKRVLIIDPNPESRRNTARLLKLAGMVTTSAESCEFLASLSNDTKLPKFDFCFITLPQDKSVERVAFLEQIEHINPKKIIILYSGCKPIEQHDPFNSKVSKQMMLPFTLSKLRSISNLQQHENISPIQRKLHNLPLLSVLAVDDMPINLKLLTTFLKNSKINLTTANSGSAAIEQCKKTEYDLILMDIQMPNIDGVQTTQHIRKIALNMGTPIIALTAHAFNEDKQRFLSSGFDDFLPKPIDLECLIKVIELWCKRPDSEAFSAPKVVSLDSVALVSLDWELAVKRANYNEHAARELLGEFVIMLPKMIHNIKADQEMSRLNLVHDNVHKLHGACCYTGVPRLQRLCLEIESQFKTDCLDRLELNLDALAEEANLIVKAAQECINQSID
ncbi:response regulator [Glaciecola sp.]|nr:response regulator [Glaciecola sp.]